MAPLLNRRALGRPIPPRRIVHLGVGAFHRAHQAAYTERLGPDWGIAAFTGRSPRIATELTAQDGLYTLLIRGAEADTAEIIGSIAGATDGADRAAWLAAMADPEVTALTVTVTESGYAASGPAVRRIRDGLRARAEAGAPRLAVISCDNLPDNSRVLGRAVRSAADPDLTLALDEVAEFVPSMVDRITPATSPDAAAVAVGLTGYADAVPVVTEPFSEWVIAHAEVPLPPWDTAGARFVPDVAPFEQRKLRLLNGAHSLLAYRGLADGLNTVAEALAVASIRAAVEEYWTEARLTVALPPTEVDEYLAALRSRFANPRLPHRLEQIAADGRHKLANRIVPVLREQAATGRPGPGTVAVLAAYARWRDQPLAAVLAELDAADLI